MFQDFSFNRPARLHTMHDGFGMDGDLSPTSSGFPQDEMLYLPDQDNIAPSRSISLTELTDQFDQHSLRTGLSNRRPLRGNVDSSSKQAKLSFPHSSRISIRRQRQALTRRQCSSTHLSVVAALAERILRDGSSRFASTHPSSLEDNSSSGPPSYTSSPTLSKVSSNTSLSSMSTSTYMSPSEDGEAPSSRMRAKSHSSGVSKRSRRRTLSETLISQDLVLKAIRLRRNHPQTVIEGSLEWQMQDTLF